MSHYYAPANYGLREDFEWEGKGENRICGDFIAIRAAFEGERIREMSFESAGCVIAKAAASFLSERVRGMTKKDAKALVPAQFMEEFFGGILSPARMQCALLPLEIIKKIR